MNYTPHTPIDIVSMLDTIGIKNIEDLYSKLPQGILNKSSLGIPEEMTEKEITSLLRDIGRENKDIFTVSTFLGAGAYSHFVPPVVDYLSARGEFATSYTPYQPEVSQGTLTAMFEYQSMLSYIFGVDVVNSSMYDGASSLAEAIFMAANITGKKKVLVSCAIHPDYIKVVNTYTKNKEIEIVMVPFTSFGNMDLTFVKEHLDDVGAVIVGYPNFFGVIEDLENIKKIIPNDIMLITSTPEPLSLGTISPPGKHGVDIVTGEGMSFGMHLGYGGPYLGIFGTSKKYVRKMPGRIVGETHDAKGRRGYVLTLATREQHIRRAKATSNICSNEALCALRASIYLSLLGKKGFSELSEYNMSLSHYVKDLISSVNGFELKFKAPFYNEFVIDTIYNPSKFYDYMLSLDIVFGLPLGEIYSNMSHSFLLNVTEMIEEKDIEKLQKALEAYHE